MAHIHEKIDFTVAIFVVQDDKVLLIHHRKLNKWLPLGVPMLPAAPVLIVTLAAVS